MLSGCVVPNLISSDNERRRRFVGWNGNRSRRFLDGRRLIGIWQLRRCSGWDRWIRLARSNTVAPSAIRLGFIPPTVESGRNMLIESVIVGFGPDHEFVLRFRPWPARANTQLERRLRGSGGTPTSSGEPDGAIYATSRRDCTVPYKIHRWTLAQFVSPAPCASANRSLRLTGEPQGRSVASLNAALWSKKRAWLMMAFTVSARKGLVMRNVGSGRSPVKSRSG